MEVFTGKPIDIITYLLGCEKDAYYDLTVHKEEKKRSLSANAYLWVLVTKLAEKLRVSNTEIYNQMIARYGYPEYLDGKVVYFILPDRVDVNRLEGIHLKATSKTQVLDNGELNRVYIVMRGSSTYNTVEMTRLLGGVISEAKECDIDVITVTEKDKMLERWAKDYEVKKNKGLRDSTGSKTEG